MYLPESGLTVKRKFHFFQKKFQASANPFIP
jgi:hypothetical protein